jgi:hypothetical protein
MNSTVVTISMSPIRPMRSVTVEKRKIAAVKTTPASRREGTASNMPATISPRAPRKSTTRHTGLEGGILRSSRAARPQPGLVNPS